MIMCEERRYDPSIFEWIKSAEKRHFWFLIRRKLIFDRLRRIIPPPAQFLELGCGCGNVSSFLAKKGYTATGCDCYHIEESWSGYRKVQADALKLPFKDNYFDIVGLFDILEHFSDAVILLKEAVRVVKKNGIIVVTVPARKELWSYFDELSLHKTRYAKGNLRTLFKECKLKPLLMDYMFMFLYIPAKLLRTKSKRIDEEFKINGLANVLLIVLFEIERFISRFVSLPIGTSIIVIGRKD